MSDFVISAKIEDNYSIYNIKKIQSYEIERGTKRIEGGKLIPTNDMKIIIRVKKENIKYKEK